MRVTEKRWGRSLRRVAKFRKCFGGTRKKLVVQRCNWDVNTAYTVPMAGPHQACVKQEDGDSGCRVRMMEGQGG